MRATWNVTRKELRASANGATVYLVAIVFLLLWEYLFFRNVFLVGEASLRGLFDLLPWLLLILVPALTMGSISQERRDGTLELLLTHPVRDRDLLLGKFLSGLAVVMVLLAFTFPIALSIAAHGNFDWGEYAGQLLAATCLAASLVALGTFVSSLLSSQVSALLVTAAAAFVLVVVGDDLVAGRLPLALAAILDQLSVASHYRSMARGVIDVRDVFYFATFIAVFLASTMLVLMRRRFGGRRAMYRRAQVAVGLLVAIAVLVSIVGGRIPGRVDLTENGRYSVSDATRDTLRDLDDVVRITLYASSELPAQLQPTLRDTTDLLRDYDRIGGRDVVVEVERPSSSKSDAAEEARSRGVQEVQFNVVGNEELALKQGFLGAIVSYGGDREAIPFIGDTGDLEYQLTSLIVQLTQEDKPAVGMLALDEQLQMQALQQELSRQYDVRTLSASDLDDAALKDLDTLVVAGGGADLAKGTRTALQRYLDRGGSALMLVDSVAIDLQTGQATKVEKGISSLLERYGVEVRPLLAYDARSHLTASFGGAGGMSYFVPYAMWPRTQASREHAATKDIQGVPLLWPNPLRTDKETLDELGAEATPLLRTTASGGVQDEPFDINPQTKLSTDDLERRTLAVAVAPRRDADAATDAKDDASKKSDTSARRAPRLVVVGDSDFVADQLARNSQTGIPFAVQSVSWLSKSASLASIRVKGAGERVLEFEEEGTQSRIRWGNLLLALLLPSAAATWRVLRRRRLSRHTFATRPPKGLDLSTTRTKEKSAA